MIVFRLLLLEVLKSQLAVFTVLIVVFISRELVSILADASEGKIVASILFQLIGLNIPKLATMILPMSFFLGVLLAFGRMYADSEMVVLRATGVSEWYVTRVTLLLALVMAGIAAWLTLFLNPHSKEKELQMLEQAQADTNVHALIEGRFRKSNDGSSVIFVEKISKRGNKLTNVFVAQMPENWSAQERGSIVRASTGVFAEKDTDSINLELHDGERYEGSPTEADYERITFERYIVDARSQVTERKRRKLDAAPTIDLLGSDDPDEIAELHWRLAIPLSLPILALLAVPLSSVNPRQGAFGRLLPAILMYLGYYVLLMAGRKALQSEAIPASAGLWWVHAIGVMAGVSLIVNGRETGARIKALVWSFK
ncbi:LPS export ABC transporter permease LptF [Echinimonas agarilytica]|uniref:Lipopolysaccharide export system permease protein LptF n=1 Tax=Echinimonas agarilytica TaxID=1215918 RepID=A0AA41W776_9GAMM|nr:LPS export ABC transporter permease LptF [Echinimonas agarilytica]MCM2680415.1 LPS export ABC transporter permease LptF [Echinimonas agarilytica]